MMGLTGLEIIGLTVYGVIYLAFLFWIARDAQRHGMNAAVWIVVVLLLNLVGVFLYFIARPSMPTAPGGTLQR